MNRTFEVNSSEIIHDNKIIEGFLIILQKLGVGEFFIEDITVLRRVHEFGVEYD